MKNLLKDEPFVTSLLMNLEMMELESTHAN
jgi:hypothetical protein